MSSTSLPRVLPVLISLIAIGTCPSSPIQAQNRPLSEQSEISLITILPGDPVYTFAGHSAIRVHDPVHNIDRLYNYGTFNFNDPLFIPKFTYGYLRYSLSVSSTEPMLRFYDRGDRPVIEQTLNLRHSQRTEIFRFLQWNARPENRHYQYDFFFDNCSTRIRDVLQETLGDDIDFSPVRPPDRSFRELLDPYVASRPAMDLGFDIGLGLPADRQPSGEEVMFLPVHLLEAFEQARVSSASGPQPLVSRTDTLLWADGYSSMDSAFDWPWATSVTFLILVLAWTGREALQKHQPGGLGDATLLCLAGFVGLGICYLWFISTYAVTDNNLNLMWAWPTHLVAAYMLLRRPRTRGLSEYLAATGAIAGVIAIGWPVWPQNLHAAVLPFVLGIGIRAGWWSLILSGRAPVGLATRTADATPTGRIESVGS